MRIKRFNDAGVAAESSPSQHEQIFDLSQVIRSVGVELWRNIALNDLSLVSIHFYCTLTGLCSPGAAVGADCQECTRGSNSYPALSA